jgi:hypothetical protein
LQPSTRVSNALSQQAVPQFKPDLHSAVPLEEVLGFTPRVAEHCFGLPEAKPMASTINFAARSLSDRHPTRIHDFKRLGPNADFPSKWVIQGA